MDVFEVNESIWKLSNVEEVSKLYDSTLIQSLVKFTTYENDHEFDWGCHTGFYYLYGTHDGTFLPSMIYVRTTTDDELKSYSHFDNTRDHLCVSDNINKGLLEEVHIIGFGVCGEEDCSVLIRLGEVYVNKEDFNFCLSEREDYLKEKSLSFGDAMNLLSGE